MKRLKIKTIFWTILALDVMLLVAWAVIFFLVRVETNKIAELEKDRISMQEKRENMSTLSRLAEETKEGRALLSNYFVSSNTESGLLVIEELSQIAKKAGVELEIGRAESKEGLRLELKAKGTYPRVFHFLTLVESFPFGLKIEALNLETNAFASEKGGVWTASFILTAKEKSKI